MVYRTLNPKPQVVSFKTDWDVITEQEPWLKVLLLVLAFAPRVQRTQ